MNTQTQAIPEFLQNLFASRHPHTPYIPIILGEGKNTVTLCSICMWCDPSTIDPLYQKVRHAYLHFLMQMLRMRVSAQICLAKEHAQDHAQDHAFHPIAEQIPICIHCGWIAPMQQCFSCSYTFREHFVSSSDELTRPLIKEIYRRLYEILERAEG